jgi:tetratricopeptide (TPR) repeat protein
MELLERIKILNNYLSTKNYKKVIEGCNKILKKDPNNSYVLNLCGLALQGNNNILASIEFFNKAIQFQMNNLSAMNNLANSYKGLSKLDAAEELYLKTLKINPRYVHALNNYGNLKQQIGNFKTAIELYLKALDVSPNQINIMFSLASAYQEAGDFKKSEEIANKILDVDPKNTSAHKLISGIINYKKDEKHLRIMENLSKDKNLSNEQLTDLSFALGKAYEDINNYQRAYENLEKGNRLKKIRVNYKIDDQIKLFKSIVKTFEDVDFNNFNKIVSDKKIIFICGMPRSGTTLVEQIIASHKNVIGAGELIYLQNSIEQNFVESFKLNKQKILDQAHSSNNIIEKLYLNLLQFHKFNSKIITDKAPQNFRWIGFMKIFFPNCKIIHCNRNARDNCLSLFKNNFASTHMDWSYDQKDIAEYYNLYSDLMNFWNKKLPDSIYNANYEKIVEDKENEIKKLIKFCDLDWDPACLNHHKNTKTPISTVSVAQARKPIYNSSLNSNSKYSNNLTLMFETLKV